MFFSKIFFYFHFLYFLVVIITTFGTIENEPLSVVVAGFIAPLIAWFGGAGLRGSFNVGDRKQKITGLVLGLIFLTISLAWLNYSNYWVIFFDIQISGPLWGFFGFLIGLIFATKKHSKNEF